MYGWKIEYPLVENKIVKHDDKSILKTFKTFYSNIAANLLVKFPKPPNRYTINLASDYYRQLAISEKFKFFSTAYDPLFYLLTDI